MAFNQIKVLLLLIGIIVIGVRSEALLLSTSDFNSQVVNSEEVWLIEFFAPWCRHCQSFSPIYDEIAQDLIGKVRVAKLDATVSVGLKYAFGVRRYPTFFRVENQVVHPYRGKREKKDMIEFVMDRYKIVKPMTQFNSPFGIFGKVKASSLGFFEYLFEGHALVQDKFQLSRDKAFLAMFALVLFLFVLISGFSIFCCVRVFQDRARKSFEQRMKEQYGGMEHPHKD